MVVELKMYFSYLNKCSKYFEIFMSERWKKLSMLFLEFVLEVQVDIECYKDCFLWMYLLFCKGFKKDVKYSFVFFKVVLQIEFYDLMVFVLQYVLMIKWFEVDEIRIREYLFFLDFFRNYVEDLVVWLGLDVSEEDCYK